ncbi:putative bifunctional diguanylate cyclase/phosphodiesterase [Radiobacillus deserti]|nr:EAL domain-containing protein [Radiobacillus deserti]
MLFMLIVCLVCFLVSQHVIGKRKEEPKSRDNDNVVLIHELKMAMKKGDLTLFYQPILNKKGEIVSVEALLRWNHDQYKFVSPELVIDLAEKSGLIFDLGEWVLRESCHQLKDWHQQGLESLKLNVNLSPMQFLDNTLVSRVEAVLQEVDLSSKYLELELTETFDIFSIKNSIDQLYKLKAIGVSIAIDDFGMGFSSFKCIHQLPIDQIKIDRSFVWKLHADDYKSHAIIKSIIYLAKELQLEVVAEGIETSKHYQVLAEYACDKFQGYYFHKPLSHMDFQNQFILQTAKK